MSLLLALTGGGSGALSFSVAVTDGADTLAAQVSVIVAASSATTDGADVLAASIDIAAAALDFSVSVTDGADVLSASIDNQQNIDGGGGKSRYWQPYWMDKRAWEKKIPPEAVKAIERVARSSKKGDEAERELMLELADYESRYGDMLRLLQQSQFVTLKALKTQQLAQLRLIQDEEDAELLLLLG